MALLVSTQITGSLTVTDQVTAPGFTGSLVGTASHATVSETAVSLTSTPTVAVSASWASSSISASYAPTSPTTNAATASYVESAGGDNSTTGSWVIIKAGDDVDFGQARGVIIQGGNNVDALSTGATSDILLQPGSSSFDGAIGKVISYGHISASAITASLLGTASYATSASYAPGSPSVSASYADTASHAFYAGTAVSSDFAVLATSALTASYLNAPSYATLTTSSNWITASFLQPENYVNITVGALYSFTCSNVPSSPEVRETSVFIYNTAATTSSLSFPSNWTFIGSVPTSISSSKSAMLSLKAYGNVVVAGFGIQY